MFKPGTGYMLTNNGKMMVGAASVAVSTKSPTLWQWLGEHHESIASTCAILSLVIMAIGLGITFFRGRGD